MVQPVKMPQRPVGRVAPAVRLAREKADALLRGGVAEGGGEVRRQRSEREEVDGAMAFVVPRVEGLESGEGKQQRGKKTAFHGARVRKRHEAGNR